MSNHCVQPATLFKTDSAKDSPEFFEFFSELQVFRRPLDNNRCRPECPEELETLGIY